MHDKFNLNELFGTLLQSVTEMHIAHLQTRKYSRHVAFDEYYKEAPEAIDKFIERVYSTTEPLTEYKNVLWLSDFDSVDAYLAYLRSYVYSASRALISDESVLSSADDIIELIDSLLYKIKNLYEGLDTNIKFSKVQREYLKSSLTHNSVNVRNFFEQKSRSISELLNKKMGREYKYVALNYAALFYSPTTKLFALVYPTYRKEHYVIATMPMIEIYNADLLSTKTIHIAGASEIESAVKENLGKTYQAIYIEQP